MRLTIVNQFYRPDIAPTAHLAASLAAHRAAAGDEVTIIAGKGAYTAPGAKGREGGRTANPRVLRVWTPGLGKGRHLKRLIDYGFFYLFAAFKLLTLRRQDVIVSLTTPPLISWCALLHKRLHGRRTRLVLWNMDCYPDVAERADVMKAGGLAARFCHARNRAVFRHLDHLICLDEAMARLLCGHYASAQPEVPVTIIPNWEDAAFFPKDPAIEPWEGRDRLGLQGKFVVLYLGNMGYGHDFATVLDAAESLKDEAVVFLFVGGGRQFAPVEQEVARRGLTNVVMQGYVPKEQTPAVMGAADCALVTLRDDALGVMSPSKIHSNLAMGLPLIYVGPATSNVDEAIRAFGCGVSLRHGQSGALAEFVRAVARDRERRGDLRARARRAFERAFCDTATLPLFDGVIHGGARAASSPARRYSGADPAGAAPAIPTPRPVTP